ncbi:MAG: FAD-dependent monooxygenase [Gammaproteobacteria bacterium]|nr:FAD-dependent monooxygenase [Gammaproteobacteria bacterium]
MNVEVLIVGAGPTGLVLALWLSRLGVRVRLIDRAREPGTTSRALAVQARTLELYRQLDLAAQVVRAGHQVPALHMWVQGRAMTQLTLQQVGAALTPYPFALIYPQDEHERLLIARLAAVGVTVERGLEFVSLTQDAQGVEAELRTAQGAVQRCRAAYLAGCDGARSRVRECLGGSFAGGTYQQVFYVADIAGSGPCVNGDLHVDLDEADFLAVFPLAARERVRLVGTVAGELAARAGSFGFKDVSRRAIEQMHLQVQQVNWFSSYHVHHRVTERFRHGRVLLLGDAAHIHSPVGGQGMNTGIGDAINLAWKLAAVLRDCGPDTLLDSYDAERRRFARTLVATTDRIFTFVNASGRLARFVRTRVAPRVLALAFRIAPLRRWFFRTVAQFRVHYRGEALSRGRAGRIRGGDRLPWVATAAADNFAAPVLRWQVHVYGRASAQLRTWCADQSLPLREFAYEAAHRRAGFARDAVYLLRPDEYVALAAERDPLAALIAYFAQQGLRQLRAST